MESIIKENENKDILMITNDEDYARYLSPKVEMMNTDNWLNLFTVDSFREKYNFIPSIAGVCVWKACFGDGSDNIKGESKELFRQKALGKQMMLNLKLLNMLSTLATIKMLL